MNTVISGGTGFIGSQLALRCLSRGDRVKVLGLANSETEKANRALLERRGAAVIAAAITDDLLGHGILEQADVVFHLAAAQHEMNIPDETFWKVNVAGTRNILQASEKAGVRRFVHGSTIGVYGPPPSLVDESTPCHPDNVYGRTKLEAEEVALSFSDRLSIAIVRIPEVYGPGDRRLLKLFRMIDKGSFALIGSGENLHHLLFIDDLIEGLWQIAELPRETSGVFLLAGREPVTTNQMVSTIAAQLGKTGPRLRIPMLPALAIATTMELALRPLGIQPPLHRRRLDFFRKSFELSSDHARETFAFDPKVSFEDGVKRTILYYRELGLL